MISVVVDRVVEVVVAGSRNKKNLYEHHFYQMILVGHGPRAAARDGRRGA